MLSLALDINSLFESGSSTHLLESLQCPECSLLLAVLHEGLKRESEKRRVLQQAKFINEQRAAVRGKVIRSTIFLSDSQISPEIPKGPLAASFISTT